MGRGNRWFVVGKLKAFLCELGENPLEGVLESSKEKQEDCFNDENEGETGWDLVDW